MTIDKPFRHYIENSTNVELKESDDWWFSRANQQKYIFNIAAQLVVHQDYAAEDALSIADDLCSEFHARYINKHTRKGINHG